MAVDEERGIKRKALATEDESTEKRPRNDDDTKEQSIVPTSNAIIITNLVRPLITRRVQEYVSQHGTVKRFFLDAIKTHAYVIYENNEQAVAAYRGMDGIQFPKDTGRNIAVRGMTAEQVESMIEQEQAAAAKHIKFDWESALKLVCGGDAPAAQAATSQESTRRPRFSGMGQITRQLQQAAPVVERRTVRTTPPTTSNKLDTLFRKTKSTPALYYMPVSDEVAKARLERFRDEVK
ncbi:hypothetical protein BCR43DRAFT_198071 [Syncephalastrum racemosum]|uniref:RRM domain-containing protein n=1 Tax=Syncephalastrum racemosum TaxID=13706 RepID=A0A1X2HHM6_SYNRA|nr:hypothetical protein BCR43DRAFT_198071 [Syncephalastrum racemosum]